MSGRKLTKAVYISPEDMSELTQHWELFECEDDEAPERLEDDGEFEYLPLYATRALILLEAWKRLGASKWPSVTMNLLGKNNGDPYRMARKSRSESS